MGEKGNMLDTGLPDVGSGLSGGQALAGGLSGEGSGGRHESGIVSSVAKAAVDHARSMGEGSDTKNAGLAGLLPSGQDEKPPAGR